MQYMLRFLPTKPKSEHNRSKSSICSELGAKFRISELLTTPALLTVWMQGCELTVNNLRKDWRIILNGKPIWAQAVGVAGAAVQAVDW